MLRLWANAQPVVIFGWFLGKDWVSWCIARVLTDNYQFPDRREAPAPEENPISRARIEAEMEEAGNPHSLLLCAFPRMGDWGEGATKSKIRVKARLSIGLGGVAPSLSRPRNVFGALLRRRV